MKHANQIVDTTIPVFTEEEVYMIGGWLAEKWGKDAGSNGVVKAIDKAIQAVLSRD